MSQIIFIRHSETKQQAEMSSHEWVLTETGRERCLLLAQQLKPYSINRIITSEEAKANLTGRITAERLGIPCETAPDLQETKRETVPYFDKVEDFKAALRSAMEAPDDLLFGEETFTNACARFSNQVDKLREQYPDETLAIVTHGTVLSVYLSQFLSDSTITLWESLGMPAYAVVSLEQGKVIKFVPSIE